MEQQEDLQSCLVSWRGQKFVIEMHQSATLKEFGEKLQELTNVKSDTLRLLVPMGKSSKLIYPFSEEYAHLTLDSASVLKGKSIRMMGVSKDEIDEVLQNAKLDLRIAGFDEEEKRLKHRSSDRSYALPQLPRGAYTFHEFRTLTLPGIELNPSQSKALELLHKLASDPGIVAIMNKHRWQVGILTELAPVGYVGISPTCILGFNKNHGEEISLRLRTDDLKGFRKYASIKKTLLHELAHMVFSEHDSNFYALDKQLNKEAETLDWTKSRGHTLTGAAHSQHYDDDDFVVTTNITTSKKLGGAAPILPNARATSVIAAFQRLSKTSNTLSGSSKEQSAMPDSRIQGNGSVTEPDPDDSEGNESMVIEPYMITWKSQDDNPHHRQGTSPTSETENYNLSNPEDLVVSTTAPISSGELPIDDIPDDVNGVPTGHDQKDSHAEDMETEADSGEAIQVAKMEPDPDDPELQIIQDPVAMVIGRLQTAIQSLKYEVKPSETGQVLQTIIKIIRNVIEHPDDMKFKKLRKGNPMIQRNIISYKAAMDVLSLIGFVEDVITDELGKPDVFLTLKRNDPGLLWLAKSSLETSVS